MKSFSCCSISMNCISCGDTGDTGQVFMGFLAIAKLENRSMTFIAISWIIACLVLTLSVVAGG